MRVVQLVEWRSDDEGESSFYLVTPEVCEELRALVAAGDKNAAWHLLKEKGDPLKVALKVEVAAF
ncbi:MAG: hypothetical protein HY437_02120 [Candidatus Magasanikbacteria bacterium]|nr:hypothetical protein [Candidatus Magasanikbacteria bacterium]